MNVAGTGEGVKRFGVRPGRGMRRGLGTGRGGERGITAMDGGGWGLGFTAARASRGPLPPAPSPRKLRGERGRTTCAGGLWCALPRRSVGGGRARSFGPAGKGAWVGTVGQALRKTTSRDGMVFSPSPVHAQRFRASWCLRTGEGAGGRGPRRTRGPDAVALGTWYLALGTCRRVRDARPEGRERGGAGHSRTVSRPSVGSAPLATVVSLPTARAARPASAGHARPSRSRRSRGSRAPPLRRHADCLRRDRYFWRNLLTLGAITTWQ